MGRLPFSFHPLLIFSYLIDALFSSFCTDCSNLPAQIIVDHRRYFRGTTDMLLCGKSIPMRSTSDDYTEVDCWRPCNPFDFRNLTGIEYTMIRV